MGLLDKLLKKKAEEFSGDDFASLATELEKEMVQVNAETDDLAAQMAAQSPEDKAWMEWFSSLSERQKNMIEQCSGMGIFVTKDNIDQVEDNLVEIVRNWTEANKGQ